MTYYDEISKGYEELHKNEQLRKVELIGTFLCPQKDETLLDVGCGTGITTQPWNCKRYGLDPASKLIERARQSDKIKYVIARAEKIPYEDNFFDYVISITALQNFDDIGQGLEEIKRVGKTKFVLSTLKRSSKINEIKLLIEKHFDVMKIIEEDKDLIFRIGF